MQGKGSEVTFKKGGVGRLIWEEKKRCAGFKKNNEEQCIFCLLRGKKRRKKPEKGAVAGGLWGRPYGPALFF